MRIDFDDIWQKYSKDSRIDFACFSFCVGLLFYQLFCVSNWPPKIVQILMLYQGKVVSKIKVASFFLGHGVYPTATV